MKGVKNFVHELDKTPDSNWFKIKRHLWESCAASIQNQPGEYAR